MKRPKICVVGACNVDLTSYSERMPCWGETLRGHHFELSYGGKGANQAVMAAKLGAQVSMVGLVGDDVFGKEVIANMESFGIDVSHIKKKSKARTGVAQIMVDDKGKNAIIVVTGASDFMAVEDIQAAKSVISKADVLLVQWEIPIATSREAMNIAKESNTRVVFNPAPIGKDFPDAVFPLCDTVCLNETEISALVEMPVEDLPTIKSATNLLMERGVQSVIVTLGEKGAYFASKDNSFMVRPQRVTARDTTGAGDCFIGSFSYFFSQKRPPRECVAMANKIAGISVQGKGTQTSYPDIAELTFLSQ